MAVFLQSLSPPEKDLNSPHQGRTPTLPRRCSGEASGQTRCCGHSSLRHWTRPDPQEGDEGMRVGKQSRDPALPWISGCLSARGGRGAAQRDWGLL